MKPIGRSLVLVKTQEGSQTEMQLEKDISDKGVQWSMRGFGIAAKMFKHNQVAI